MHDNFALMSSRTVYQALRDTAAKYGSRDALLQPITSDAAKKYRTWTWAQYLTAAVEVAAGLALTGTSEGRGVRPEFGDARGVLSGRYRHHDQRVRGGGALCELSGGGLAGNHREERREGAVRRNAEDVCRFADGVRVRTSFF